MMQADNVRIRRAYDGPHRHMAGMLDTDAYYAALARRDPRYDGLFFVAVRTTRIYCRPICPARTPFRCNVVFYEQAAQAQEAGFRPCLRCRPESAPDSPAWLGSQASVNRALRLIEEGVLAETSLDRLAERLGLTARHLRRLFVKHLGVGPLAIEQTRRVHLAKKLLHETSLPVTEIAFASGFGSLRRFNETFRQLFGRPPSAIRRDAAAREATPAAPLRLRLAYRPTFDWSLWRSERSGAASRAVRAEAGAVLHRVAMSPSNEILVMLRPGPGHSIWLEIERPPVRDLARIIGRVKRDLFAPPEGAPVTVSSQALGARATASRMPAIAQAGPGARFRDGASP